MKYGYFFAASVVVFAALPAFFLPWYISDELWYVSSARNLLHDLFGWPANGPYYTVPKHCVGNATVVADYGEYAAVAGNPPCYTRRGYLYPREHVPSVLHYYNLEHPPLAKYVLAYVLSICDWPQCWRLPSLALAAATAVLVYSAAQKTAGRKAALAAAAALPLDATFRAMSAAAMLEIYLAFFTALAAYLYLRGYTLAVGAAVGLAASVKYSGAFLVFGLAYLYRKRPKSFAVLLAAAVAVAAAVHAPLFLWKGAELFKTIADSVMWQLKSKPPGPVASSPLDWLFMQNSFLLYINPNIYASGTPVYLIALIYALVRRDDASILYLSAYGGYWLVYLAGNYTLYSFYTAHFSPLAHIVFARLLHEAYSYVSHIWRR